jgi:hypothetical protein
MEWLTQYNLKRKNIYYCDGLGAGRDMSHDEGSQVVGEGRLSGMA